MSQYLQSNGKNIILTEGRRVNGRPVNRHGWNGIAGLGSIGGNSIKGSSIAGSSLGHDGYGSLGWVAPPAAYAPPPITPPGASFAAITSANHPQGIPGLVPVGPSFSPQDLANAMNAKGSPLSTTEIQRLQAQRGGAPLAPNLLGQLQAQQGGGGGGIWGMLSQGAQMLQQGVQSVFPGGGAPAPQQAAYQGGGGGFGISSVLAIGAVAAVGYLLLKKKG